jgi:hypothetical protein
MAAEVTADDKKAAILRGEADEACICDLQVCGGDRLRLDRNCYPSTDQHRDSVNAPSFNPGRAHGAQVVKWNVR